MTFEFISSIKDERIVSDRELNSAAGRTRHARCQIDGLDGIINAIESGAEILRVYFAGKAPDDRIISFSRTYGVQCFHVSDGVMKKLTDTSYLIPEVGIAAIPQKKAGEDNFAIVMDHVVDHGNIGTIIRSAAAFGINDLISTESQTDFFYKKIISASRGKVFESRISRFSTPTDTIRWLKEKGYQILATSPHATGIISRVNLQDKPVALVIGNESDGVCDEIMQLADLTVLIPMYGQVESLNVGVAAGISLYELKFRMVLAMLKGLIRSNLGREINVTSKRIISAMNKPIKQASGLESMQVILMMILKCDEKMSLKQVSADTALFGDELNAFLEPMITQEFIDLHKDTEGDYIILTKEGERAISELWPVVESAQKKIMEGFTEQEEAQLREFLLRIQKNCDLME
ncbi:MAG: hypothetical protein LWY06_15890 [Firmicutes bacterium]|nr:hypothetical protein [Bacillota bacterium]